MRMVSIPPAAEMRTTAAGEPGTAVLAPTEALCPHCLRRLPARRQRQGAEVFLLRQCPEHGLIRTPIWRGEPDILSWQRPKQAAVPSLPFTRVARGCPFDCGLCPAHGQHTCTALIEITQRCNLHCPVCFAGAGQGKDAEADLSLERIAFLYDRILAASGPCNIQLSGGEPTLHEQLPAIIRMGRDKGFSFLQLNSNGLLLAETPDYAKALRRAGLSSVFLQFDGCRAEDHLRLRGRDLGPVKEAAIKHCAEAGLGVVLVPTLLPGVNDDALWDIVRHGVARAPVVRGVHFQPISYFGRYPQGDDAAQTRLSLPELLQLLHRQSGGRLQPAHFAPPACEHALCSLHASFLITEEGGLTPLGGAGSCCSDGAPALQPFPALEGREKSVACTARQWGPVPAPAKPPAEGARSPDDFDRFLARARTHKFSISAMFFQDAWTLDLERLRGCCIHVAAPDGTLIPFCAYNLSAADGRTLHRGRHPA